VAILGITFLGIQFIRPELKNMPATADLQVPPAGEADTQNVLLQLPFERNDVVVV